MTPGGFHTRQDYGTNPIMTPGGAHTRQGYGANPIMWELLVRFTSDKTV